MVLKRFKRGRRHRHFRAGSDGMVMPAAMRLGDDDDDGLLDPKNAAAVADVEVNTNNNTDAMQFVAADSAAAGDNNNNDDDDRQVMETQLARAWFARRKNDLLQQQEREIAAAATGPVDVDDHHHHHHSVWDLEEEPIVVPSRSKSSSRKRKIMPDNDSYNTASYAMDESQMSSAMSIATSDSTQIISNKMLTGSTKKQQQPTAIANVQTQDTADNDDEEAASSSGADAPRQRPPPQQLSESDFRRRRQQPHCGGFFDWETRRGKVVCILILLLLLSLITLGVAAFIAHNKKQQQSDAKSPDDNVPRNSDFGSQTTTSLAPTLAPSVGSISLDSRSNTPVRDDAGSSSSPKPSPESLVVTSKSPTIPSSSPTTIITNKQTPLPTKLIELTRPPTTTNAPPTVAPISTTTALQPTLRPTTFNPILLPTAAPTVFSLDAFVSKLLETSGSVLQGWQNGDAFGSATALSANGKVLAVGAPFATSSQGGLLRAGRVQVFAYNGSSTTWQERGVPMEGRNAEDLTGSAVSLNGDGSTLAVSEPGYSGGGQKRAGNVRVYTFNPVTRNYDILLGQEIPGPGSTALLGVSLQLSDSGRRLVVGAPYYSGTLRFQGQVAVYEFVDATNEWKLLGDPLTGSAAEAWFGMAADIHEDNESLTIVASAPHHEGTGGYVAAYRYKLNSNANEWTQLGVNQMTNQEITASSSGFANDRYGSSLSLTKANYFTFRLAVGIPGRDNTSSRPDGGMAVVYELDTRESNTWRLLGEPIASNNIADGTGTSVQLINDGNILLVGSPGANSRAGQVRLYQYDASNSSGRFLPSNNQISGVEKGEEFGFSLSAARRTDEDGGRLVIAVGAVEGARGEPGYVMVMER